MAVRFSVNGSHGIPIISSAALSSCYELEQIFTWFIEYGMLARRRLGLKSHSRSSPVTGGLVLGACLQSTRTARESFRTSGIHKYPRCPADSANGGGRSSVQSRRAAAFFLAAHSSSTYLTFHSHICICRLRAATS